MEQVKDELQEMAIQLGCGISNRIVGITGQAGTGKTTIMKQVHDAFRDAGYDVALAAPTGRAAKRISEATGIPATTLHRLLEFSHPGDPDPKTGKPVRISMPRRNKDNRLQQTVILVDEYSMVNRQLDRDLLDAIPSGGLVRVFGDIHQLPPIEEGYGFGTVQPDSPFKMHLKRFPSVTLKNIYRQGEGSDIITNAHRILSGWFPQSLPNFPLKITQRQQERIIDHVMESGVDFGVLENQIITPTHRGPIGTIKLNEVIQGLLRDNMAQARVIPRNKWDKSSLALVKNDKILWTKNDYNIGIFNGETGVVEDFVDGQILINFGDRTLMVPPWVEYEAADGGTKGYDPRVNLRLAYAITTHAAQGSECIDAVHVMDRYASMLQDRQNMYTACTRARKSMTLIADQWSVQKAVSTVRTT